MFATEGVSYKKTASFSSIVLDYIEGADQLRKYYLFQPNLTGIATAIEQKKQQTVDRELLVSVLQAQYQDVKINQPVQQNITALLSSNTFTVCTAHQPNLFTGPLYFIYKILHAIKLAKTLTEEFAGYQFVPVYYMGSEDADLQELNHIHVEGKKYEWNTTQTGAVGQMKVDKPLLELLEELRHQIGITVTGAEFIQVLKSSYIEGATIQQATFKLVHHLFAQFGLVVLIPDNARLKKTMQSVFEDDLFKNIPSEIVAQTSDALAKEYKAQAYVRPINLFYLTNGIRERIEKQNDQFIVVNTAIKFTEGELRQELQNNPERFSPNVILRGLYQETILPNIAFIGGGGELAYWLQLKGLFQHYGVVFPVLVIRNSFLIIEPKYKVLKEKLGFSTDQFFCSETALLNIIIEREGKQPDLSAAEEKCSFLYDGLKNAVSETDPTLLQHLDALKLQSLKKLQALEVKLQRAERRKRSSTKAQIEKLKSGLFPNNNLQERVENLGSFYAKWGLDFIDALYENSQSLEQEFVVLTKSSES